MTTTYSFTSLTNAKHFIYDERDVTTTSDFIAELKHRMENFEAFTLHIESTQFYAYYISYDQDENKFYVSDSNFDLQFDDMVNQTRVYSDIELLGYFVKNYL